VRIRALPPQLWRAELIRYGERARAAVVPVVQLWEWSYGQLWETFIWRFAKYLLLTAVGAG